jgi:hypothetical protein
MTTGRVPKALVNGKVSVGVGELLKSWRMTYQRQTGW